MRDLEACQQDVFNIVMFSSPLLICPLDYPKVSREVAMALPSGPAALFDFLLDIGQPWLLVLLYHLLCSCMIVLALVKAHSHLGYSQSG